MQMTDVLRPHGAHHFHGRHARPAGLLQIQHKPNRPVCALAQGQYLLRVTALAAHHVFIGNGHTEFLTLGSQAAKAPGMLLRGQRAIFHVAVQHQNVRPQHPAHFKIAPVQPQAVLKAGRVFAEEKEGFHAGTERMNRNQVGVPAAQLRRQTLHVIRLQLSECIQKNLHTGWGQLLGFAQCLHGVLRIKAGRGNAALHGTSLPFLRHFQREIAAWPPHCFGGLLHKKHKRHGVPGPTPAPCLLAVLTGGMICLVRALAFP